MTDSTVFYSMPANVGNAMLQYLSKRPYEEVYALIQAIQQLKPVPGTEVAEIASDKS